MASLDPVTARTLAERCADHLPANAFPPSMLCMAEHGIPLMLPLLVDWPPHEVEAAERACIDLATEIPAPLKAWFQCLRDNGARVSLLAPTARYDVATIGLDRVAAALSACEQLDSDAPSSMGPTWLHAD